MLSPGVKFSPPEGSDRTPGRPARLHSYLLPGPGAPNAPGPHRPQSRFCPRPSPHAIASGADETELYATAIDALVALHKEPAPKTLGQIPFFDYDETALLAEIDLLTEWFLPLALGRPTDLDEQNEHRNLWQEALTDVLCAPRVFVHRDYHAQNLIWMPERHGITRVGMVDFQDAVAGHAAYDLISLLEDARRDVSPELADAMTAHYLAGRSL